MSISVSERSGPDAEESEPPRGRRRRLLVYALIVVVVLALAAALTWVVAFSTLLGVRSVQVRGTHLVSYSDVRAASGIVRGTPLVRLDTGEIQRRVEKLRQVDHALVSTSFPSTVSITVVEREPVGYERSSGGADLVDRHGVHFRTVATAPAALPRFVLPTGAKGRSTGAAVATVAAALPAALRARVESLEALDPTSITLVLTGDRVVRWGSADRSAEKARVLATLVKRAAQQIDVTDPDQPFTR